VGLLPLPPPPFFPSRLVCRMPSSNGMPSFKSKYVSIFVEIPVGYFFLPSLPFFSPHSTASRVNCRARPMGQIVKIYSHMGAADVVDLRPLFFFSPPLLSPFSLSAQSR